MNLYIEAIFKLCEILKIWNIKDIFSYIKILILVNVIGGALVGLTHEKIIASAQFFNPLRDNG